MNPVLASIYGTHGQEKVASEGGQELTTLSDLALALVVENQPATDDFTKVAAVANDVLEELEFYDLSGRAAAHAEFTQMEKAASEGDFSALEAFFAEQAEEEGVHGQAAQTKNAILAELARRTS